MKRLRATREKFAKYVSFGVRFIAHIKHRHSQEYSYSNPDRRKQNSYYFKLAVDNLEATLCVIVKRGDYHFDLDRKVLVYEFQFPEEIGVNQDALATRWGRAIFDLKTGSAITMYPM